MQRAERSSAARASFMRAGAGPWFELVELRACGYRIVDHEQVQAFFALHLMDRREQHAARVDAHHRARRQVHDGDERLADELFGFVVHVNARKDHAVGAGAVVEHELEELLAFADGFAFLHLDGAEVGPAEGFEVDLFAGEGFRLDGLCVVRGPCIRDGADLGFCLGIPEAEKKSLAGVGAQYDSEVVYHNVQKELKEQGVIYVDFETAVKEYEDLIRPYFGQLITPNYHKFAALHYAVWSGGSFVYVPKGVHVRMPLQSYFRLNAPGAGQFEHTLIIVEEGADCHFIEGCSAPRYNVANLHAGAVELFVKKGASLRYSTIENWSKNMYNLNTKRAVVEDDGSMVWVSGSFGSHTSCLYPDTILRGNHSTCEFTGITFAGKGQFLDTGSKVEALGKNTHVTINSKSISKAGGTALYRGAVFIGPEASGMKGAISCESLMLDNESRSDTIPAIIIENSDIDLGHEAKIGRISEEDIYYLMSRGMSEEDARAMLVRGFAEPISKALPLEYAVEMNRLIDLEFEGAIG